MKMSSRGFSLISYKWPRSHVRLFKIQLNPAAYRHPHGVFPILPAGPVACSINPVQSGFDEGNVRGYVRYSTRPSVLHHGLLEVTYG